MLNVCTCDVPDFICRRCGSEAVTLEARIALVEQRIRSLTETLHALRHESPASTAVVLAPAEQTIDIGALRLTVGGRFGARLETAAATPFVERVLRSRARIGLPLPDVHTAAQGKIWDALAAGCRVVRIDGAPGAGVTTLLEVIATAAADHGYPAGALQLDAVVGPARDVAQRLAMLVSSSVVPHYAAATELAHTFAQRHLVLFDAAELTADDLTSLCLLLPGAQFVVAQRTATATAETIELGALRPQDALLVLASAYGREIDSDNRRVALDLCLTTGSLPGPARLIATAARAMQRSFISLRVQYDTGDAVLRAFIGQLAPLEKRLLAALHFVQAPLDGQQLGVVTGELAVTAALDRLVVLTLVRRTDDDTYELPGFVAPHLGAAGVVAEPDALFGRVFGVLRAALDAPGSSAAFARRLIAAERLLYAAARAARWEAVLACGPPLGQALAAAGLFGAWGRVLESVEVAATQSGDSAALTRVQHEFGVRSVVLGEPQRALGYLRPALAHGQHDEPAAATTTAVIALADYRSPVLEPATASPQAPRDGPGPATSRALRPGKSLPPVALIVLGLAFLVAAIVALFAIKPPRAAFAITQFSSDKRAVERGSNADLCVTATAAAVVDIFPGPIRIGSGRRCVTLRPRRTTTYIAVASNADGRQLRAALTIGVYEPAVRRRMTIGAFFARPARIAAGESTQLCYRVTGARRLRLAPYVGHLIRLEACETVRLSKPQHYTYRLFAFGDDGQSAVRQTTVDVAPRPTVAVLVVFRPVPVVRRAAMVYQFDATPGVVRHGQSTSLCAGIDRHSRGYVTHLGALQAGITRCYRVNPQSTTTYRLYVRTSRATEMRSTTVYVRPPAQVTR